MALKTVLKVAICCEKCKVDVLKAVSSLEGVDKMEVDAEKGQMTVIGEADPYAIITKIRKKTCKFAQLVTVGPPPKPEEKKEDDKDKPIFCPYSWTGPVCGPQPMALMTMGCDDSSPPCSIM